MTNYSVYFFCNECSQLHPMGVTIALNDGPQAQASIGDTYAGKELPPSVATLSDNRIECPTTRKLTSQKNNDQVFLVPIG
jgi:hypothetical protein